MVRPIVSGARPFSVLAALLLVVLTLGLAGPATADPGNGKGAGNSTSEPAKKDPPGQKKKAEDKQSPAAPAKTTSAPAKAKSSPGKAKTSGSKAKAKGSSSKGTSGSPTSPQPISNADANSGGANGQCPGGPYCSTRDGSPSQNGNGDGKATGKPCAGCVGKADNKNPKGQMPNGSDHNNGYECDGNNGIGKTNPAHTGCVDAPPPPPPPPPVCVPTMTEPCEPPPVCVPTPGNPCVPPPVCVPTPGNPCVPPTVCVPSPGNPCKPPVDRPRPPVNLPPVVIPPVNLPPVVAGVETEVSPGAKAPPPVTKPQQVLPATGATDSLAALGYAGLLLSGAGALTVLLHRRLRRS